MFCRVGLYGSVGPAVDKDSIGRFVKRLVKRAKLANPDSYGGHSLRAGFVTEASANGATDREIMKQTGHKSIAMVHRYARGPEGPPDGGGQAWTVGERRPWKQPGN